MRNKLTEVHLCKMNKLLELSWKTQISFDLNYSEVSDSWRGRTTSPCLNENHFTRDHGDIELVLDDLIEFLSIVHNPKTKSEIEMEQAEDEIEQLEEEIENLKYKICIQDLSYLLNPNLEFEFGNEFVVFPMIEELGKLNIKLKNLKSGDNYAIEGN